ncbi:hypothetical protein D3880_20670 [Pseudomonas cavernae]|uniref:Uncharacterized protein n=1 Tax=Pseudomonas cavernae TaxID=2320867 RepID=A0A385ZA03_9PSED|nr:UPF0158 family protein [Pseudomonas cavernae]AYC34642.1 hypothetical protein D3880_20670 [Pseudomonas cavernae]
MRPLTIDLDELAFALNTAGLDHYLDLLSGKVALIPVEDADPELEALLQAEPERFLLIDPLSPGQALALMQEFLVEVGDPHAYAVLEHALARRKPFRAFKHALLAYPQLLEAWYAFEAARLRELALDWLEENELQAAQGHTWH